MANAKATAVVSVAEGAGPRVFWASDPVRPDETVLVTGENLAQTSSARISRLADGACTVHGGRSELPPENWQRVTPLQVTRRSVKFVVPAGMKNGIYVCRLDNPGGSSNIFRVNAPDPWWIQGDEGSVGTPGGWLRVCGKCLGYTNTNHVLLISENKERVLLPAAAIDGYSLKIALPKTLRAGKYAVEVQNGFGGDAGWSPAPEVRIEQPDTWPTKVFSVMDFYGARAEEEIGRTLDRGNSTVDRTDAIEAALKKAKANGGGVVLFPEGKYAFRGEMHVPPRTVLRGAGEGLVTLWWGKGGFALDGGSDARHLENEDSSVPGTLISGSQFGIEDMSLYLPRNYQTAIHGGDSFRMHGVRIRVDRYWKRSGQREDGTTLWLGKDGTVTDCDIVAKGVAFAFEDGAGERIAHNVVQAGKSNISLERSHGMIVEDNEFISTDPTAYINLAGAGRDLYYARNRHTSQFTHQSDFSWTFDGTGMAYLGHVASVSATSLTLDKDPVYPTWAGEKADIWSGAAVCILDGRGAGQYRFATLHAGRDWKIDRPFDVNPDATSIVNIIPYRGKVLVIGNRFEDASWVNMGYGSSFDVVCANNSLYRVGMLMNEGLRDLEGIHASWYIQYLGNEIYEGHTTVQTNADMRNMNLYAGPLTRAAVHRRQHIHSDNSGRIEVGADSTDVIVEGCRLDNPRGTVRASGASSGVLFRNNVFGPTTAPRYEGDGLPKAVVLPIQK